MSESDVTPIDQLAEQAGIIDSYVDFDGNERPTSRETKQALLKAMGLEVSTDAEAADRLSETGVASEPEVAGDPAPSIQEMTGQDRLWGMTAALYGLRSDRGTGIGDYDDLATTAEALGKHGASFLGINPVHAVGIMEHEIISPYSPSSRSAYNLDHIALDRAAEMAGLSFDSSWLDGCRDEMLRAPLIDYAHIRNIHVTALGRMFKSFQDVGNDCFEKFLETRGNEFLSFARFETISEMHGPDWRQWPSNLSSPDALGIQAFLGAHDERVRFHMWVQWLADMQLADAQARSVSAGMSLGLYLDIAVGVRPGGADVWANQNAMTPGVTLGAPPDAFNPNGQDWSLSPYSPSGLINSGFQPFKDMLQATMQHAGMVRIDHALGLKRGFWIPQTGEPGAYVRYPTAAMLAIVAEQARRHAVVVVGEDLGLVPPSFRDTLAQTGLYGCAVMQFERDESGRFHDPRTYREHTLACFGTHDTPTLRGYCHGRDLEWFAELDQLNPDTISPTVNDRQNILSERLDLDVSADMNGKGDDSVSFFQVTDKMHAELASSGSAMVAVQLDDALNLIEQQNLPGITEKHPNWRRTYPVSPSQLGSDSHILDLAETMKKAGRFS